MIHTINIPVLLTGGRTGSVLLPLEMDAADWERLDRILDAYRQSLSNNPQVVGITGTRSLRRGGRRTIGPEGERFQAPFLFVDHDYLPTMGIELRVHTKIDR